MEFANERARLRLHMVALGVGLAALSLPGLAQAETQTKKTPPPLTQPVAPVRPVTDTYFGQKVTDPYRWLEDLSSSEVKAWLTAQNDYTRNYLSHLPDRDDLVKRVEQLDNATTRVGGVSLYGSRYFYFKLTPQDQTPKLYARDGLDGKERLLADPQVIGDDDDKRFTISDFYPSWDGKLVAVEIAAGGSEEGELRVIDATTGKLMRDSIDRIWGASVSWDPADKFFYYVRLKKLTRNESRNDKELDSTACLHRMGTYSGDDIVVLSRQETPALGLVPTDQPTVSIQPDSPYAIAVISHGVQNEATLALSPTAAVEQGKPAWQKFVDVGDDVTDFAVKGHEMWLLSHKDASRFKVLHLDLDHPDMAHADVVMPASDLVLHGVSTARDALYIDATKGGISQLLRLPYGETQATPLALPFAGSVGALFTNVAQDGALMRLSGWTQAPQWYAYNPTTNQLTNTNLEPLNPVDFSSIKSQEVTATGADGTPIPLSIIYQTPLELNARRPCLLEGYGAYGISIEPGFDATRLALLEKGIILAYAHVRGGGENGEDWHLAGQKQTKQNTINDFIACAEYLVDKGYTSPAYLAGRGTSAGGITIGGALTRKPHLFTLAICNVGVMDILRFESEPNGPSNTPEFGTIKDPDDFKALYQMDAYQHVKDGTGYPEVLLITGLNDPRVSPWHLMKMAARLQAATSSKNPILLRVDSDAGHGIGSSKTQRDLILADQAALLLARCPQPVTPAPSAPAPAPANGVKASP